MPSNRRFRTRIRLELTWDQKLAMLIGDHRDRPEFKTVKAHRAAWEEWRAEYFESGINGRRPTGRRCPSWWIFDAKSKRDHSLVEAEQLFQMGEIDEEEQERCRREWAASEAVAFGKYEWRRDYCRQPETGAAEYHRHRCEMGIVDSILPPVLPMPAPGWEAREKGILSTYDLGKLAKLNGGATA